MLPLTLGVAIDLKVTLFISLLVIMLYSEKQRYLNE